MREAGVKPELELFNPGHIPEAEHLVDEGLLEEPYWATVIFGMQNGMPPGPQNLSAFVDNLPDPVEWQCLAVGKHQLPMTTAAITMGGHVRVGMEDNVYYRKGELAESNAQLVRRTARIADELERPVASPQGLASCSGSDSRSLRTNGKANEFSLKIWEARIGSSLYHVPNSPASILDVVGVCPKIRGISNFGRLILWIPADDRCPPFAHRQTSFWETRIIYIALP